MDDLFPHLGEPVLERIVREAPESVLTPLGIARDEFVDIHRQVPMVFPNTDLMFDGFSTIDLALELADATVVPIEVKLGHTGLARATMNQKLADCTISGHQHGARVSGNVLAVLNRYFNAELSALIGEDRLHAQLGNRHLPLTARWGIVARDHIIASWTNYPPRFNGTETRISLETICRAYGRVAFNDLVESILGEFNFFDTWIGNDDA
jgi:hypothetical protein